MFQSGIVGWSENSWMTGTRDGALIEGVAAVRAAHDRGVLVLPYDHERRIERLGGYCREGWGDGWSIPERGARICPMLIAVVPERPHLYWAAVVVILEQGAVTGMRMLANLPASDTSVGLSAADGVGEGRVPAQALIRVPFIVRGRRTISAVGPGRLALDLFASGSGAMVLATAATQSRIDAMGW